MVLRSYEEDVVLDRVDGSDRVVGKIKKSQVFEERAGFRAVHILVFNPNKDLLLQRIASTKERHPGYWGSSAAGYVRAGESYEEAAQRKLRDELGVSAPLHFLGKTVMLDEGCKKFIGVFRAIYDGAVRPDLDQIDETRWVPTSAINDLKNKGAKLTPTFVHVMNFLSDLG